MNFTIRVKNNSYKVKVGDTSHSPVTVEVDGETFEVEFEEQGGKAPRPSIYTPPTQEKKTAPSTTPAPTVRAPRPSGDGANAVVAPMPGKVLKVNVKPGDSVSPGDVVCVLEAMKMEQVIKSNRSGVVAAVPISPGQTVTHGTVLVQFQD